MTKKIWIAIFIIANSIAAFAQTPAFPTAEGYGKWATGGRGGKVVEVTTVVDDVNVPGSLRWAIKQYPGEPLTVVFKVSGTIVSTVKYLELNRSNVTYAGQTAPGDGICFRGAKVKLNGNNVILRNLRFRVGDDLGISLSCIGIENFKNLIIDHCSFSWSTEENVTMYDNDSTTMQYCLLSEPLYNSYNYKGARGYSSQWGGEYASYHHNLLADAASRAPRFNGSSKNDYHGFVDFRNNVLYNCAKSYGGEIRGGGVSCFTQMVNNYYRRGPATRTTFVDPSTPYGQWYVTGNFMEGNDAANADNWKGVGVSGTTVDAIRALTLYDDPAIPIQSAEEAYQTVIESAGAIFPKRDSVDLRIIDQVTGVNPPSLISTYGKAGIIDSPTEVGGWPTYVSTEPPTDTDSDGMPDEWEVANGLDPNDAEDRNKIVKSGYTCLEVYLNSLMGESIELDFTISEKKVHDFVVAKDGTGDYTTINEAIEAAPDNGERTTIFVKKGIYAEKVFIGDRWVTSNKVISLIGENVDNVIITWDDYHGKQITYPGKDGTISADGMTAPTMTVTSPNFYMENITVMNPSTSAQAEALYQSGDQQLLKNCKILGNQDTHRTKKGRRYFYFQCTIEGGVDFIYGGGTCSFYQCDIISNKNGYLTAPEDITYKSKLSSGETIRYGFIFNDCDLIAKEGLAAGSVYLGRPWGPECGSVFMNCRLGKHINAKGWESWNGNESSACFAEFNSMNEDSSELVDISNRVDWSIQLSAQDVNDHLLLSKVYSSVSSTRFDPAPMLIAPDAPTAISVDGNVVSWSVKSAAEGYVIYANGEAIGFNRSNHYADTLTYATPPVYTVRAVGPLGNLSLPNGQGESFTKESINEAINTAMDVPEENGIGQTRYHEPTIRNGFVCFDQATSFKVFSVMGKQIIKEKEILSFNLNKLSTGIYIFLAFDELNKTYSFKVSQ
ncbi:MAG: pectinesterase family protein [Prolixibacteraceae bacterium]